MRKFLKGILLAIIAAVAGTAFYRRRAARHREHVDLYAEDGTMVSLKADSPDAVQLLSLARELVL